MKVLDAETSTDDAEDDDEESESPPPHCLFFRVLVLELSAADVVSEGESETLSVEAAATRLPGAVGVPLDDVLVDEPELLPALEPEPESEPEDVSPLPPASVAICGPGKS